MEARSYLSKKVALWVSYRLESNDLDPDRATAEQE